MPVSPAALAELADADARENYAAFLAFRDALLSAGSLQACYGGQLHQGAVTLAPVFMDAMVQALLRQWLDGCDDAVELRAAEMLFRPQRITLHEGRVLAGDADTLQRLNADGGFGAIGRLLAEARLPLRTQPLAVLNEHNQAAYRLDDERHRFVLDLTPTVTTPLAHGLGVPVMLKNSGLAALGRVLQRWVEMWLQVRVRITPQARIADAHWRWHIGLDAESTALLNALYRGEPVDDERQQRLIGLYTLHFENPAEMQSDVAGKPVYLGLAMDARQRLRIKPQNLLLNLPLARPS